MFLDKKGSKQLLKHGKRIAMDLRFCFPQEDRCIILSFESSNSWINANQVYLEAAYDGRFMALSSAKSIISSSVPISWILLDFDNLIIPDLMILMNPAMISCAKNDDVTFYPSAKTTVSFCFLI